MASPKQRQFMGSIAALVGALAACTPREALIEVSSGTPTVEELSDVAAKSYQCNKRAHVSSTDVTLLNAFIDPPNSYSRVPFPEYDEIYQHLPYIVDPGDGMELQFTESSFALMPKKSITPRKQSSLGMGFHIGNGLIVTSYHVAVGSNESAFEDLRRRVIFPQTPLQGKPYTLLAYNPVTETAVLKVNDIVSSQTTPVTYLAHCFDNELYPRDPSHFFVISSNISTTYDRPRLFSVPMVSEYTVEDYVWGNGKRFVLERKFPHPTSLKPGDSGAPLFTNDYLLVGVVIGGDRYAHRLGGIADNCAFKELIDSCF